MSKTWDTKKMRVVDTNDYQTTQDIKPMLQSRQISQETIRFYTTYISKNSLPKKKIKTFVTITGYHFPPPIQDAKTLLPLPLWFSFSFPFPFSNGLTSLGPNRSLSLLICDNRSLQLDL
jgi:hypothetical protein